MAMRPALAPPQKAAAAAPKKTAPAAVVTLKTLFEELDVTHELPKKQAHAWRTWLMQ